ncbi:MAG: glycosyltransferase [Planctomyces sp.]|nr:glycosyltransferase [Planctomyces sp.]
MAATGSDETGPKCIFLCGGGSGGHLTPGIAVAEELGRLYPDCRIVFLTSDRPVDRRLPELIHLPIGQLTVISLRIPPARDAFRKPWSFFPLMTLAFIGAIVANIRYWPDRVIGLGGIASVPGVLIGRLFRRRVLLMEQNTSMGSANQWLCRFADVLCTGLPLDSELSGNRRLRIIHTGIPLRRAFTSAISVASSHSDPAGIQGHLRILILGGSQGAARLNQLVVRALCSLEESGDWAILHQAGEADRDLVLNLYRSQGLNAEVRTFIDDVATEMRSCSIAISRAGATTIAELCSTETPAILVPLKTSARNHQVRNAEWYSLTSGLKWIDEDAEDAEDQIRFLLSEIKCNSEWQQNVHRRLPGNGHGAATAAVIGEILNGTK